MSKKYYEKLLSDIQNQSKPVESKFGSYILKKFGWEKGKGLGKHENGEVNIMKIKKYGEHGLGYKENDEKDTEKWWENMYNNCAKNIKAENSSKDSINNKNYNLFSSDNNLKNDKNENIKYSIFIKKDNPIIATSNKEPTICNLENKKSLTTINDEIRKKKKKKIKIKNKEINKKKNYEPIIITPTAISKRELCESENKTGDKEKININKKKKKKKKNELNDIEDNMTKKEMKIKKKEKKDKKKKKKEEKKKGKKEKKKITDEM